MNNLSIIIPVYNCEDYIADAIKSVMSQSYTPDEIIVVDDGSTDKTVQIVKSFPNVKYFYQNNSGVSVARNSGIKYSTGKYLIFLDADDTLAKESIKQCMKYFIEDPEIEVVRGFYEYTFLNSKLQTLFEQTALLNKNHHGILLGAAIFNRAIFNKIGYFDPSLKAFEDLDLWLRISAGKIDIKNVDVICLHYLQHGRNTTHSHEHNLIYRQSVLHTLHKSMLLRRDL